jgi:hypothetical protein
MKSSKLFFIIIIISYFFGMFFRILIEAELDFYGHIVLTHCDKAGGYFEACFNMWSIDRIDNIIILKYFSFTTLSTVGFGDFHP